MYVYIGVYIYICTYLYLHIATDHDYEVTQHVTDM